MACGVIQRVREDEREGEGRNMADREEFREVKGREGG